MNTETGFCFENVSFCWPGGRPVLENQSFSLPAGTFTLVRGPSGSGKSTLLRLMVRLEEPDAGEIRYQGRGPRDRDPPRLRRRAAYLRQAPVVPDLSVREVLLAPFSFAIARDETPPSDGKITARLEEVLLGDIGLDERAAALSGGQRQRLCLVRALLTGPEFLLLDEPTSSLDDKSRAAVEDLLERQWARGLGVVMATHDGYVPRRAALRELRIQNGRTEICP